MSPIRPPNQQSPPALLTAAAKPTDVSAAKIADLVIAIKMVQEADGSTAAAHCEEQPMHSTILPGRNGSWRTLTIRTAGEIGVTRRREFECSHSSSSSSQRSQDDIPIADVQDGEIAELEVIRETNAVFDGRPLCR